MTSSENLAYLAGIMDGEGMVTISNHSQRDRVYLPKVAVNMTHRQMLQDLADVFGGNVRDKPVLPTQLNNKPQFIWQLTGQKAVHVCEKLLPWLRIKRAQEIGRAHV